MISLLPVLFLLVAWLYAMAGFGGGSTYIALLAVSGLPLTAIPVVALTCNLIVSGQGSVVLVWRGHAERSLLLPLLLGSIPFAFIGGAWRLPEATFLVVLAAALSLAGVAMLVQGAFRGRAELRQRRPAVPVLVGVGVVLGLLAGVTGIGGGIYLAPVMHLFGWGRAQAIATCTSLFIALNSLAGLVGQLTKGVGHLDLLPVWVLVACPVAVLVGGRVGTYFLTSRLPQSRIRLVTAGVILLVAVRLWLKVLLV